MRLNRSKDHTDFYAIRIHDGYMQVWFYKSYLTLKAAQMNLAHITEYYGVKAWIEPCYHHNEGGKYVKE